MALHSAFTAPLKALGLSEAELPNLVLAHHTSETMLRNFRDHLQEAVPAAASEAMDVVVFGSAARREMTELSDLDYLVVGHGLPSSTTKTRELLRQTDEFLRDNNIARPGSTGMFGGIVSATELVERIGLEQDTNASHSRRVLILEESESVYQPALHERLRSAIVERYVSDYSGRDKHGPPRFLLNDVMRYWRTIAVDYQAKRWQTDSVVDPSKGWGLRYLKLLVSRKLSYASALAVLLTCGSPNADALSTEFAKPPLRVSLGCVCLTASITTQRSGG